MATETINAKIDALQFIEGLVPATPAATRWRTYFKTDGYYYVDDAGAEIGPLTGAGAVAAVDELQYTTGLPAPADAEGLTYWDSVNGTLAWHTDIAGVTVNGGQEVQIPVKNVSGSTLLNGQVVYISGAASGLPKIDLAKADATATSNVIAMVTADIANGLTGKVTAFGSVRELDTSGFTAGDKLYLSATTAGAVTATMPVAPNFKAVIGVVEVSNATTGKIHFTHGAALSLTDIADINETTPTDGQILQWDNANSYYIPTDKDLELIGEVVLGAPAASMSVSSIPATYRHLRVLVQSRSTGVSDNLLLQFNADATVTNYYNQRDTSNTTTVATAQALGTLPGLQMANAIAWSGSVANSFGQAEITIPNYATGTMIRQGTWVCGFIDAFASGGIYNGMGFGAWNSTAAITQVTTLPQVGPNFATGSIMQVYGVR